MTFNFPIRTAFAGVLLFVAQFSQGQERLIPLRSLANSTVYDLANPPAQEQNARSFSPLDLPFFDDFSGDGFRLEPTLWDSDSSYVSKDMPIDAPSFGVVVLDALDRYGLPYSNQPLQWGKAEDLTSQPINLNVVPSDSIYMSFYVQAGGIGNIPEPEDSLVLQFYRPLQDRWSSVWNRAGEAPNDFARVNIAITDTSFLHSGFRFRFRKFGTLSGNLDHWLIDYIYLDANRGINDTLIDDVAIVRPLKHMFQNYSAVPYRHLLAATDPGLRTGQNLYFFNHSGTIRIVNFGYEILQDGALTFSSPVLFNNSNPGVLDSFNLQYNFANLADNGLDASEITIRHYLRTLPDLTPSNDTLVRTHALSDYYAYDDGTAERGYTLNAQFGKVALKFAPLVPDTLRGLDLYFAPVLEDPTLNEFRIAIWASVNGVPGSLIYKSDTFATPQYTQLNEFVRVAFDTLLVVSDTVFVGYEQRYSNEMHIGWDRNTSQRNKLYYNVDNTWMASEIDGTLMIRPIFGAAISTTLTQPEVFCEFEVYPNPSSDFIYLCTEHHVAHWELTDVQGRRVMEGSELPGKLSVAHLESGMYVFELIATTGARGRNRLIIR